MRLRKQQTGAALLTALFIMTLVAIVATAMSTRLQSDIYRTRMLVNHDKVYLASQAVSFWAMDLLQAKKIAYPQPLQRDLVAIYPQKLQSLAEPISISGAVYDLQARFNINNVRDKQNLITFINLLNKVNPDTNSSEAFALTVKNWISDYDLSRGTDKDMAYYLAQKPAYYPAHQLMNSITEIRLLRGISVPVYLALKPYLVALPETTLVNINTAPKTVLKLLGNGLSDSQVAELLAARGSEGFKTTKDYREILNKLELSGEQVTLESKYFLSISEAHYDNMSVRVYTVLKRNKNKQGKLSVSILSESINDF